MKDRSDRYHIRLATDPGDIRRAQRLRWHCFLGANGGRTDRGQDGYDQDAFDAICDHVLIKSRADGRLVGCFRVQQLRGSQIGRSYSASHYDLTALAGFRGTMLEVGRFCIDPLAKDPDILRLSWGMLTWLVDQCGAELLFGCTSFRGADPPIHRDALALLGRDHLGPEIWRPGIRAAETYPFADELRDWRIDAGLARAGLPPLLRGYLHMGGWVGDHVVIDRHLDTLHVFTGLEVSAIPPTRRNLLRKIAT